MSYLENPSETEFLAGKLRAAFFALVAFTVALSPAAAQVKQTGGAKAGASSGSQTLGRAGPLYRGERRDVRTVPHAAH